MIKKIRNNKNFFKLLCVLLILSFFFSPINDKKVSAAAVNDYTQWRQGDAEWNKSQAWPKSQYPNATLYYMKDAGCTVTCIAMLLRHYNVVTESDVNKFNPWICNEKLKSVGAFNNAADLIFGNVSKAYSGFVYQSTVTYSLSQIKSLYNSGYACMVVVNGSGGYEHYVAVKNVSGNTVNIMDPGSGKTVLSQYASPKRIVYYKATASSTPAPNPTPTGTQTISDGEYHIVSALDSRYALDVSGASKEDRANIDIYRNTNDAKQTFHVTYLGNGYYKIINSNSGKALDAEDYGTSNGTNVIQYRSTNNSNQQWVIKESEDGQYFYIISKCNGLYVDVSNGVVSDKNNVQMWTGNKSAAQKWRFIAWGNNTGQTIPDGRYHVLSGVETSKGLDVYQGGTANLSNVQLYKNNRSVNQTFDITYLGSGYYKIIDVNSGKSLDVQGNNPVKSANVCIYDYNSGASESKQWIIKSTGGGWYNIISKGSGLCLDVANGYTADRTNIQMWTKNSSNAQKWAFVPVRTDNKITFHLNGGTKGSATASRKIDAYNYGRGAGQLLIYECENFTVTTNKYGREAAVDANGKVTAIRPYNSDNMLTVPRGGFIVSGHLDGNIPDSGVKFVDKIQAGSYVGYDLKTNTAYAYGSQNDYLFDFKYVSSGGTYGTLPTPTRSGYDFAGWYTSASGGSRVTSGSRYTTDNLYAHWTKQKTGSIENSNDSVNNSTTIGGDKTNHSVDTAAGLSTSKLHVRGETIYLKRGTKRKISTIVIPMNTANQLIFTSSNSKVAKVNKKGVVKAKKVGKAVITVRTPSGLSQNVNVQVMKKDVKVKKVSYIKKNVTLQKGYLGFLGYKVTPWNTTDKMTWTSSKKSVITVDDSGRYWTKKKGTAKITIKVGKKKAVFRVRVK